MSEFALITPYVHYKKAYYEDGISPGGNTFKAPTAVITLAASASVMAQGDVTLSSLAHDAATRTSSNQMVKDHQLPVRVTTGGTDSPAQTMELGSESWRVLSTYKPHNCGHGRIMVIWSEKSQQMFGVYSVVDEKTDQEKLIWFNVNDALSIDGKIVLFATLSGSLDSHPDASNYP